MGGYNGCQRTGGQNRQGSPMDLRSPGADGPLIYPDVLGHLRPGIDFSLEHPSGTLGDHQQF